MEFLPSDHCLAWAERHGFPFSDQPFANTFEAAGFRSTEFQIPSDAGRRIALARVLWDAGRANRSESLLWVTAWSIWPSGEHLPLVLQFRKSLGETRQLVDSPGHLFRSGEDDVGVSFLVLSLLFLWDAYLLSASGELAIFVSHDGYGVAFTRNADARLPLEQQLATFRGPAA